MILERNLSPESPPLAPTMEHLIEGAELVAESGTTYLAIHALGQPNVWIATQKDDPAKIVVVKGPSVEESRPWPRLQHEMIMHELFKPCEHIRRQIDRIPFSETALHPPMIVLEIFESTLWHARTTRPFSRPEIVTIASDILKGLQEIHSKGLVYADLKMQNVMINGFTAEPQGDDVRLTAKLGDLGIVMAPAYGKVQPVSYRAPEVYFKQLITEAADIWAFGLVCCHLLEAKVRFDKAGLYDDLYDTNTSMTEREQAVKFALANDYNLRDVEFFKEVPLPYRDQDRPSGLHWEELRRRGLEDRDIDFLKVVLKADPQERLTARSLLTMPWFQDRNEHSTRGNDTHTEIGASNAPLDSHPRGSTAIGAALPSTQEAQSEGAPGLSESDARPAYLGLHSASGGTYLSYS